MTIRPFTRTAFVAAAVASLLALTGCSTTATVEAAVGDTKTAGPTAASPTTAPPTADTTRVQALLATLPVKGKAPKTGYDRVGDFGQAWKDMDRNGCDTRNDLLAVQLKDVVKSGTCKVMSGTLNDPYTGKVIHFVRGPQSADVQLDHLVALSNAWQTGAQQLTQTEREQLANDPTELLAVDGPTNEAKSDGDAATWLPPQKSYRCAYVSAQVTVKAKYHLWVTTAEHDAIARILTSCHDGMQAAPALGDTGATSATVPDETNGSASSGPATRTSSVTPGGVCADKGATGTSASGRTYHCGSKGTDAVGHWHWNS